MKYQVTYYNEFYDQYYKNIATNINDITTFPIRKTTDILCGNTIEQCIEFVKDFLDVPEKLLTIKEITQDFGIEISDINAEKLLNFYNSRYTLFQQFLNDIDATRNNVSENTSIYFKYILPEEINLFSVKDNEKYQLTSYIEIKSF